LRPILDRPRLVLRCAVGISRGGRSIKIHAIVDGKARSLNFLVTGGQATRPLRALE
jgi:hypothetical protein